MPTWEPTSYYFSGQGVVLLGARDADGTPMGLVAVGNVSDLKITINVTTLEHKESTTGQRATDLRLTTETKCGLTMTIENFISENLETALRASLTEVASGTVTDATVKVRLGKVTPLPHVDISTVVIEDGVTPLVAGTDYWVNEDAGSIKWAATISGVVDNDPLTISYAYGTQRRVDALTEAAQEIYMRFEGLNTADGNKPVVIEVFKFLVDPLKELALIGDGVGQFVLEGSVLADPLQASGSKFFKQLMLR